MHPARLAELITEIRDRVIEARDSLDEADAHLNALQREADDYDEYDA